MILKPEQLMAIAPGLGGARAGSYANLLSQAMEAHGIDSPRRVAFFLGQLLVESGDLTEFRENMNYKAERLMQVWPKRFPTIEIARQYERNPAKLANKVYANRMGNGDEASGDGWRYRGAGWIQLTGKTNQLACAMELGMPVGDIGDWLATPAGAAQSAAWYWWKNGINRLADFGNIDSVSDAVNLGRLTEKVGDAEGFQKRALKTELCKQVLRV